MGLLTLEETAQRLGVSSLSLADKRYRNRIGLPVIKVGRRLCFEEGDIMMLIKRGRERRSQQQTDNADE